MWDSIVTGYIIMQKIGAIITFIVLAACIIGIGVIAIFGTNESE